MFNRIRGWASRYQLTIWAALGLLILWLIMFATLIRLGLASIERDRLIRRELIERDLREVVSRFDADERFVLQNNFTLLIDKRRTIAPLLLPRQYYTGLPAQPVFVAPRPPPKNCYLELSWFSQESGNLPSSDRFCAYFTEDKTLGSYLFFAMTFEDIDVQPLQIGDASFFADAVRLVVKNGSASVIWWLVLQNPNKPNLTNRFELTAFRELPDGTRERDKRIEGWAYTQKQSPHSQKINIVARLDYKAVTDAALTSDALYKKELKNSRSRKVMVSELEGREFWPPKEWQNIQIELARKEVATNSKTSLLRLYSKYGITNLSMRSLATPFLKAKASLSIRTNGDSNNVGLARLFVIRPESDTDVPQLRSVEGNLLMPWGEPILSSLHLPDTNLSFEVERRGSVIEKGIWQVGALLLLILFGFTGLAWFCYTRLISPIFVMSRMSRQMMGRPVEDVVELPYGSQKDEIGSLARGFNELLGDSKHQMELHLAEREQRKEDEQRRQVIEIKTRENNLKIIGHEIRSPLQALLSLHPPGDKGHRYVDRMVRAVNNLFGATGAEQSFDSMPVVLEELDIAQFLFQLVSNAALVGITDVVYQGPTTGLICSVDPNALEDSITHLLNNAQRHRIPQTKIVITVSAKAEHVSISVFNQGEPIDSNMLDTIFELYYSAPGTIDGSNQGVGLFVAKNYISRMSGIIQAKNLENGVSFDINLPIYVAPSA